MKLLDKVVLIVFSIILVGYIIYITNNKSSDNKRRTIKNPLLKDTFVWSAKQPDNILKKADNTFKRHDSIRKVNSSTAVVRKSVVENFLSDKLLLDGLKISFTTSNLQVNVIEENEKALVYWLSMAKYSKLRKTNNTLVVFSNELDLAVPTYFHRFPYHRVPRNDKEMIYLLQSPGSYIVKAILTGIIRRIIWIRPNWAQKSSSLPFKQQQLAFGIFKRKNRLSYCVCQSNSCSSFNSSTKVSSVHCQAKITVNIDHVKETDFFTKMTKKNWLPQNNVLLHIEGSYFGCVSPSSSLLKSIKDKNVLEKMQNILKKLFCPQSIQDEIYLDRLLLKAIEYSKIEKECQRNKTTVVKTGPFANCQGVNGISFRMEDEIHKFLARKLEKSQYLCEKYNHYLDFLLKELSLAFKQKNLSQLLILKLTGFCLSTTMKLPRSFGFCKGEQSIIQSHIPTNKEIQAKMDQIRAFLKKISNKSIKTITFCRDLRRGCVPRFYLPIIESTLLKMLKLSLQQFTLNYDRHILGHKPGWYHRSYLKDTL